MIQYDVFNTLYYIILYRMMYRLHIKENLFNIESFNDKRRPKAVETVFTMASLLI